MSAGIGHAALHQWRRNARVILGGDDGFLGAAMYGPCGFLRGICTGISQRRKADVMIFEDGLRYLFNAACLTLAHCRPAFLPGDQRFGQDAASVGGSVTGAVGPEMMTGWRTGERSCCFGNDLWHRGMRRLNLRQFRMTANQVCNTGNAAKIRNIPQFLQQDFCYFQTGPLPEVCPFPGVYGIRRGAVTARLLRHFLFLKNCSIW